MATLTNLMTESQFLTGTTKTVTAIYDGITDSYKSQTGNHVVYLRAKISSTKTAGLMLRFWNSSQSFIGQSYNGLRVFNNETISTMYSLSGATYSDVSFQSIVSGESNTLTISNTVWIDLTASYGAGNEPTQAWCDEHIPYFTGTYELTPWRTVSATRVKVGNDLPPEYQEVEYLQTSGTQYIDTGFYPTNNSKAILDAQYLTTSGNQQGSSVASGSPKFTFLCDASTYEFGLYGEYVSSVAVDLNRHTFINDAKNGKCYVDNTLALSVSVPAFTSQYPFYLGARTQGGDAVRFFSKENMYRLMLYENDVIQRNLVPCRRISDSKPGMYDFVTGNFYVNIGTGEFSVGPTLTHWRNVSSMYVKTSEVPDIYQELDYISSDGNQYINTGIYVGSGYQLEMVFSFIELDENRQALFGINGSHGESFFRVDGANNYSFWARSVGSSSYTDYTFSANTTYTVRANFLSNTAQLYINGTLIKTITPSASDSYLNLEIPLFCENSEGSRVFMLRGNFMQCKMWNTSGTLIRYYKPVRLKSTSEVGVYDVVTNTMGHNAGSGTFGAGTAINGSWHQCSLSKIKTY